MGEGRSPRASGGRWRAVPKREQALKSFTKTERLDGDNGYKCDVCKRMFRVRETKHFRIGDQDVR